MKKLKFGGANLPQGSSTWYDHINPDGEYAGIVNVYPGDVVDAERVKNPDYFVDTGRAEYLVEEDTDAAGAA